MQAADVKQSGVEAQEENCNRMAAGTRTPPPEERRTFMRRRASSTPGTNAVGTAEARGAAKVNTQPSTLNPKP